jgi:pimeloyl-ACP methyl ester carboxylesterase
MQYLSESSFTSFDGEKIVFQIFSEKKKTTQDIILLHGLGGDSNAFLFLADEILKTYPHARCIALDLRGHGYSTRRFSAQTHSFIESLAKDVAALCKFLKCQKPIMIGHCLGGSVIQEYIAQEYSPTPKLGVFICSASWFPNVSLAPRFWYKILQKYSLHSTHFARRNREVHLYFRNSWDFDPFRVIADASTMGFLPFLLMELSFFGWQNPSIHKLNKPNIVLMHGKDDQVVWKKEVRNMRAQLPKADFFELQSNHGAIINNPWQIMDLLKTHYNSFFNN